MTLGTSVELALTSLEPHTLTKDNDNIQPRSGLYALTEREQEVLHLLSKGASNRDIAKQAFLTESTVRTYLTRIYSKHGITSRTEAALKAHTFDLQRPPNVEN